MKKIVYVIFGATLLLCACKNSGNSAAAAKMADEMCQAMTLISDTNPMGIVEAGSKMITISENAEYKDVTQTELITAMKEKCPDGAAKFDSMATKE